MLSVISDKILAVKNNTIDFRKDLLRGFEIFLWITAALFVFVLPWHVGGLQPVKGESYAFGFNNKIAVLGLGICLAILAILKVWFRRPASSSRSLSWFNERIPLFPSFHEGKWEYIVLFLCTLVMFSANLWWNSVLAIPYWGGEITYFLGRIDLVALGFKPYQDFQHNYGPGLLYIPLWIARISSGQLSIEDAYAFSVAGTYVLGFLFVFIFFRAIRIPQTLRPLVLLLGLAMWMFISMGLNYSPLRFTILPAAMVLFDRSRFIPVGRLPNWLIPSLMAFLSSSFCFIVSPEMGIAASVGLVAYASMLLFAHNGKTGLMIWGGVLSSNAAMGLIFDGYLHGIASFSSGGNNFPIFPNIPNLMLFVSSFLIIPPLLSDAWAEKQHAFAPLAAAICASAVILLPACYGRCDPGHVVFNGFTIMGMMFAAMSFRSRISLYVWGGLFAAVFVFLGQISYWKHGYLMQFRQGFQIRETYDSNPTLVREWADQWSSQRSLSSHDSLLLWGKTVPYPAGLEKLVADKNVGIPFGADIGIERLLKLQKKFSIIYHESPIPEWYTPKDIERSAKECLKYDFLLVPDSIIQQAYSSIDIPAYQRSISEFLSGLLLYPVDSSVRNTPYIPELELIRALIPLCEPIGNIPGYVLLKPVIR